MRVLYLVAICVIIMALGVVFDCDAAVLVGAMLGIMFGWLYFIYDEIDE